MLASLLFFLRVFFSRRAVKNGEENKRKTQYSYVNSVCIDRARCGLFVAAVVLLYEYIVPWGGNTPVQASGRGTHGGWGCVFGQLLVDAEKPPPCLPPSIPLS